MSVTPNLFRIGSQFQVQGDFLHAEQYGNGHINATYSATYRGSTGEVRYIHQRINERVFDNIPQLMENIGRVTRHVRRKLEGEHVADIDRRVLTLVPRLIQTEDGDDVLRADDGSWWRTYVFIEGASAHEFVELPDQAYQAARAFGGFLRALSNLDPSELHDTLPGFHDTYRRLETLMAAIEADPLNRAAGATAEIDYCMRNVRLAAQLELLRVSDTVRNCATHNDTKINNIMIDDRSGQAVCVIDLDTVMPGLALYDFGDMVRTATSPVAEDERNLSLVRVNVPMFEAVARGFLESAGDVLADVEIDNLVTAGKVITFESGIRFLADYLMGDTYFRINRENHNLDRARAQFALVESLEAREPELRAAVGRIMKELR